MASTKEMQPQPSPRSLTHRPSLPTNNSTSALAARSSHSRNSSHAVLSASLNANHRISRRKSVTNTAPNPTALAAALKDANVAPMAIADGRRQTKTGLSAGPVSGSLPSPPASLPSQKFMPTQGKLAPPDNAVDDTNDASGEETSAALDQARVRRASDGQPLAKDTRKNKAEVRCEKCGKGYKHGSCLTKHLWEHTPEWAITSRLLISKHQQVQLLEAASVLMTINNTSTPPESTRDGSSEQDSPSPPPSGSDEQDGRSSAGTTPPPNDPLTGMGMSRFKRYTNGGSFARSYQSATSHAASLPSGAGMAFGSRPSQLQRPPSSGNGATGQHDRDLAAAVELLSCSHNSNNNALPSSVLSSSNAPPIPTFSSQFLDPAMSGSGFLNSFPSQAPESFTRGDFRRSSVRDSRLDEAGDSVMEDDDDDYSRSRLRSEEEDEGVFGRMEE